MEIFPKNERSVKREERYFKQQGNIEFFRRAENADIFRRILIFVLVAALFYKYQHKRSCFWNREREFLPDEK